MVSRRRSTGVVLGEACATHLKQSATNEYPVAIDAMTELDGYTVSFVDIAETHSLASMLTSLPGSHRRCPPLGRCVL
jgi:hypothetical protein